MVCQACRMVETVDVGVGARLELEMVDEGVGDDLIMVSRVDVGVGDGCIDPGWLSTEITKEETRANSMENEDSKTCERAAAAAGNKSRKQCKPRKICNVPKNSAQFKPLKLKITGKLKTNERLKSTTAAVNKLTHSKSTPKLNSLDEITVETSSSKSRFRVCEFKNFQVHSASSPEKPNSPPVKTSKSSSTVVKSGEKSGKRTSSMDEDGTSAGKVYLYTNKFNYNFIKESSSDDSAGDDDGDSDQSKSENEDRDTAEVPKVKRKRIRVFKQAECNICGRSYKTNYLKRHMKTHEEDDDKKKPHRCEKCGNNHQTICGNDSQLLFQCHICEKSLSSKSSLELHIESHSNERSFQCHLCAKLFKSYNTLYNHIKTHSELQPAFACDQCEKRFKEKRSLVYHKERYHEGKVETYKCELCEKVFSHRNGLSEHMDRHRGIKKYTCEVCGKRFGRHNHWRVHLRIHSNTKTNVCTECGKGFNQKYELKRHMCTHTGIKPFKCDECGKQFIHRVYMVRHQCSGSKEASSENKRKFHQREAVGNRDENNAEANNAMLNNLVPIVEYGNMMASGEMYNLNMF